MPKKGNSFQNSDKSLEGKFLAKPRGRVQSWLDVERPGPWKSSFLSWSNLRLSTGRHRFYQVLSSQGKVSLANLQRTLKPSSLMCGADHDPGADDSTVMGNFYCLFTMLQLQFDVPHMHCCVEYTGGGHRYCPGLKTKSPRVKLLCAPTPHSSKGSCHFPRGPCKWSPLELSGDTNCTWSAETVWNLPKVSKTTSRWLSSRSLVPDHYTLPDLLYQDFG